jgi:comEA protein
MRRIGVWLAIGLLVLSVVYLLKPRAEKSRSESKLEPPAPSAERATPPEGRLNINTASTEELESLPGIGPVMATRIVEYREQHGPFTRPEDLMIIEGMGEKKYRALADVIRVD